MKFALFGSMFAGRTSKMEEQIVDVCEIITCHSASLFLPKVLFESFPDHIQRRLKPMCELFDELPSVDMVVSVGGDGTFLRTAAVVGATNIPILGINVGRLGFLAAINYADANETIDEIMERNYKIEERSLLQVCTSDDENPFGCDVCALNEIAILKQDTASMLSIHAYINDEYLTSYQADGLVVATPTGSTAYSLSIGGPILTPTTPSLILSAIAPHNLTSRPLVVDDNSVIGLKVESRSNMFLLSLDGQSQVLEQSVSVEIRKANYTLKVVKRVGHTFFETLRDKLMWGTDVRNN